MRLLLDEDSSVQLVARLLRGAGHDVETVIELERDGKSDPSQLSYAIRHGRVLLTRNHDDFKDLHELVIGAGGRHPGILVERFDNDAARNMTPRGLVVALGKLEASGFDLQDAFQILNQWR